MKVVIAIDSFKGSLTSMEAGEAVKTGITNVFEDASVIIKPLADGGEGTVESLVNGLNGRLITVDVTGPLGENIKCGYGFLEHSRTAIIEMSGAAGLTLVPENLRNPLNTTTYGVGEVIKDAIEKGCRDFIIGIGGSATNDGGIGMLQSLGFKFLDKNGNSTGSCGKDLINIDSISTNYVLPQLKECNFKIACDVNNPLYGQRGAAYVYGPQKGATAETVEFLDKGLKNFADVVIKDLGKDLASIPGTGAAGGLGFAFLAFLNGKLEPGIDIIINEICLEDDIKEADYVVTGEGKLDFQTAMGKAPIGVAKLAKKHNKRVIAFAGCITEDARECNNLGINAYFPILQNVISLEEAMKKETAVKNLISSATQVFNLVKSIQ